MPVFTLIMAISLFNQAVYAQPKSIPSSVKSPLGIVYNPDIAAESEQSLRVIEGIGSSSKDLLNEQSLKSYMMPPRHAKSVLPSATYALASCFEYYINLNNNYKDNLSPDFIKLNVTTASIDDNLTFLASTGTVSAAILPFESPNLTPSVYSAVKYKIQNYLRLFQSTTRPQQKIYDVKKAIMRGNPVIIELQITQEFKNLKQIRFWNPQLGNKTAAGTHYLVVVGYDEERKALELQNALGREWGNGGYIWVSYDDFGTLATNGYVLLL